MPHAAGTWCAARYAAAPDNPITYIEAQDLSAALLLDAESYCYSSMICIADACRATEEDFHSWATAKLYYSIFYSLRGLLALRGVGIFYFDEKPKIIEAKAGEMFRKPTAGEARGGTHGLVSTIFASKLPNHLILSQPIGGMSGPKWMKSRREEVNYGRAKYFEPNIPSWMKHVSRLGIRKSLNAYINDDSFLYTFDEDHAIFAFPILCCKFLVQDLHGQGKSISDDDTQFLAKKVADATGPIAEWSKLMQIS